MSQNQEIILVSACLVGLKTRYDGKRAANEACLRKLENKNWIPICPEQLGGLPTPREAADIIHGDGHDVLEGKCSVVTKSGQDVSTPFIHGAHEVLKLVQMQNITIAYLKGGSPSCGSIRKLGVTAALLQKNNVVVEEF